MYSRHSRHGTIMEKQNAIIKTYDLPVEEINYCKHTTIDGLLVLIDGLARQVSALSERVLELEAINEMDDYEQF